VIALKASRTERRPPRRTDSVTATAAENIRTRTPVAYAPAWASTPARKMSVIAKAMAVNTSVRGRTARVHSGAIP
jgi:hypothetical protein